MTQRLKIFRVSDYVILEMGKKGTEKAKVIQDALPEDAHIVDVRWNGFNGYIDFIIHSESFEELQESEEVVLLISPVLRDE